MHPLFVCTGNLCRSPLAERRARHRLGATGDRWSMRSVGTRAPVGAPMDARAAQVLVELGGTPDGHRSARLDRDVVAEADLVVTMTAEHRTAVLQMSPASMRKSFTLHEAVGLLTLLDQRDDPSGRPPEEHLRAMVVRLGEGRSRLSRPHPGFPDVPDPIGRSARVHREVGNEIDSALGVLLSRLVPRDDAP